MSHPWGISGRISVLAPVSTVAAAMASAAAGASLVEVGDDELIPAIRDAARGIGVSIGISGPGAGADLVREADLATRAGVGLICPDLDAAARAVQRGIAAERILVAAAPDEIPAAVRAGWAVLADADRGGDAVWEADADRGGGVRAESGAAGAEAVAAVCVWLGASVIRTRHVAGIRRSVDMTESIAGRRPPSRALRGLA